MNVTRTIAEEVAIKMVEPIIERIKEKKAEMHKMADEVVKASLPKEVKECFEKYPNYFRTANSVTLVNGKLETRVKCSSFPPNGNDWYPYINCPNKISEKIKLLDLEVEDAKKDREKTENSIVSTLLSLRTFKKVKECFPEAYEHMKKYEESPKAVLAVPVDNILQTINKFK